MRIPMITKSDGSLQPRALRFFWRVLTLMMCVNLFIGLGFIFGLPANMQTFALIDNILPLKNFGFILGLAALTHIAGIITDNRTAVAVALWVGAFIMLCFAIIFIISLFLGTLLSFTSIILWGGFGVLHMLALSALPTKINMREYYHGLNNNAN